MTTKAGEALLRSDFDTTGWGPKMVREHVTRAVAAIEAEARADERQRIAEEWEEECRKWWTPSSREAKR